MNTISRSQGLTSHLMHTLTSLLTDAGSIWIRGIGREAQTQAKVVECRERYDAARSAYAAELFVQALCDDSNLEQDWLWLSTQCVRDHERRYCLERALHINPHSWIAKHELAKLPTLPAYIQQLTGQTE